MAPRFQPSQAVVHIKHVFSADAAAITIALALAVLIRLNIIHHINW